MKKITLVLAGLFYSFCWSQDLTDQLLVHYPFDGNTNDVSGHDYHATPFGATLAPDRDGNPNSAYYFDGFDDYINFPNLERSSQCFPFPFHFGSNMTAQIMTIKSFSILLMKKITRPALCSTRK